MRILFVEDDPLIREFIVEALREEGYDVIHACDGASCYGSPTIRSRLSKP